MQKAFSQFELTFWDWYIVFLSQSPLIRKIVPFFYRITRKQLVEFYLTALLISAFGFVSGILLFFFVIH